MPTRHADDQGAERPAQWAACLDAIRGAIREGRSAIESAIWGRVFDHAGPAIAHEQGEEPASFLVWALSELPRPEADAVASAATALLIHRPVPRDAREVEAVAEVCYLLEASRRTASPGPGAVRTAVAGLVGAGGPTARAREIYALETPSGDRLLSKVFRALAVHTPPDLAPAWRRLVEADEFKDAAVQAFLGYCRAAGPGARDALPQVARALAARDRPGLFAVSLKSFANRAYSDDEYAPGECDLAVADVAGLFDAVPEGVRPSFLARTFSALDKIDFTPPEMPEGLFLTLLRGDLGPVAATVFEALTRLVGADARLALPLVARALHPAEEGAGRLAALLKWLRAPTGLYRTGRERAGAGYIRRSLDAGDFATLFALVPPGARPRFRAATLAALESADAPADDVAAWRRASEATLTGLLGDAVDSPLYTRYPVLHLLLGPALRASDPEAFDALRSVYIRSDPVRPVALGRAELSRAAFAPVDRFLYAPGSMELLELRTAARAAAAALDFRCVAGGRSGARDLAPAPGDVSPRRLAAQEEEALLALAFEDLALNPARADEVAAELIGPYAQSIPADRFATAPVESGASIVVWKDANEKPTQVWPPSASRSQRKYHAREVVDRPGVLKWLRSEAASLLRFEAVPWAEVSPGRRPGERAVRLLPAQA